MIQNMVSETGYDQELLEEHLAALCQTISETLQKNHSYDFIPFGTLDNSTGNLIFRQSKNNIHQEFYWMEPLSIVPVELSRAETVIPPESGALSKSKSKNELIFLLVALGILWIIFLSLLFYPSSSGNHSGQKGIQPKDTMAIFSGKDTSTPASDSLSENDSLKMQSNDTFLSNQDSVTQLTHETVIDSGNIDDLNKKIKYRPCVIIVGSFIKLANANRLELKIKESDYETYRGEYGKFHRVGIRFNCFDRDLKQMLEELKTKYSPDAWVLKF